MRLSGSSLPAAESSARTGAVPGQCLGYLESPPPGGHLVEPAEGKPKPFTIQSALVSAPRQEGSAESPVIAASPGRVRPAGRRALAMGKGRIKVLDHLQRSETIGRD
jgi:hypothetical protein